MTIRQLQPLQNHQNRLSHHFLDLLLPQQSKPSLLRLQLRYSHLFVLLILILTLPQLLLHVLFPHFELPEWD